MPPAAPAASSASRLQLLGALRLWQGDAAHELPASAPGWLLACLGMQGDWLPRERLALLFWPDAGEAEAQRALRVTLHRARQWLDRLGLSPCLEAERQRLRLALPSDVPAFRAAIGRGDWAEALRLHGAPLRQGWAVRGFPALDEWVSAESESLLLAWRQAALREAARLDAAGDAAAAGRLLLVQLQHDLLAEDVLQALLRLALRCAELKAASLDALQRYQRRSRQELGLDALPGTLALADALRRAPERSDASAWRPTPAPAPHGAVPASLHEPPFAGRRAELEALRAASERVCVVAGEPGVGKSRLVGQALPGALWLCGREAWREAPLFALLQALQTQGPLLQHLADGPSLRGLRRDLARLLPELAGEEVLPPADAHAPAARVALQALLRLWPAPLVLDDLQWLDTSTLDLLAALAGDAGAPRLVATLRPAEADATLQRWLDGLEASTPLRRIELRPLGAEEVGWLIERLSGRAAPRFAAWLAERTGGNPFFAIESLAALFEAGQLHEEAAGGWASDLDALGGHYRELQLPPRVAAVVRRRLGALGEIAQRVLAIAAVAGDARHLEDLAEVAGLSPWATAEALGSAQAAGLLRDRRFAHDLVREVLLAELSEPQRAVLHAGVARRLAHRLPPHERAMHWWRAGRVEDAVAATLEASALDRERGLMEEAAVRLASAMARVPDGDAHARLALECAALERQRGRLAEAARHVQHALEQFPEPATRATALLEQFEIAMLEGRLEAAGQALASAVEATPEWPVLDAAGAKLAHARGQYPQAAALMRRHIAGLRRRRPGAELAGALTGLGSIHDCLGELDVAAPLHREALALARRIGARYVEVEVANNLVWSLDEAGRLDEAIELGERAMALGDYDATPTLGTNLAYVYLRRERLDDAERLYRRLAAANDSSVVCVARGKLLDLAARRGDGVAVEAAVRDALAALAATEVYSAQASTITAVLRHGDEQSARRAAAFARAQALDPGQQQRLAEAMSARGIAPG